MKDFMKNKVLPVALTVVLVAGIFLAVGATLTQVVGLACEAVIVAMIYMLVTDAEGRIELDLSGAKKGGWKRLANWKYGIGAVLVLGAIYFLTRFVVLKGVKVWIDGGVAVALFALAQLWFQKFYYPSVLGTESLYKYRLAKHGPHLEEAVEAGNDNAMFYELAVLSTARYLNDNVAEGLDWHHPFDAKGRNYFQLLKSRDKKDKDLANGVIKPYILTVRNKLKQTGYNFIKEA